MTYFLLPKLFNKLDINTIEIIFTDNENDLYTISHSLKFYLNFIKKKIDNICTDWDIYKKYTNPYEYIHTILSNNPNISISKLKPLSRSFYKMIEICSVFSLYGNDSSIKSFHLAEGPCGFIEALIYMRKNSLDKYYGMTLISNNNDIPSWKKSQLFIRRHTNIIIENGIDNTGNLMNKENLLDCLKKYNNTFDIVTGDGGFDFSVNFNNQETSSVNLIFAQICFALAIQKYNGNFILKMFDLFTHASMDLLYILSLCYEKVYIFKPNTSRLANSEKYIICKNFKLKNSVDIVIKLSKFFDYLNNNYLIKRFINIDIPYFYKNKLEELNAVFGQQQIENIIATFNLIENKKDHKLELFKKNNINKCINWCQKYNIPYNKYLYSQDNEYNEYNKLNEYNEYNDYNEYNEHNEYNEYNGYNEYNE